MSRHSAMTQLHHAIRGMRPGQGIHIPDYIFEEANPWGWPSPYTNPIDKFLSGMAGSVYGAWTAQRLDGKDFYRVCRHEPGERRVWTEPDRA